MATHIERVVAFGGSTTLGIGAEGVGWVQMLKAHYRELNQDLGHAPLWPRIFYERGVFAGKASHISEQVTHSVGLGRELWIPGEGEYDETKRLAIVSTGVNDSTVLVKTKKPLTPLSEFRDSVGAIASALAGKSKILYVGTFPCDEDRATAHWQLPEPMPPQYEARIEYEQAAMDILAAVGATAVPMAVAAYESTEYMSNFTEDGMHVNQIGEEWVYNRVVPHFDALVRS
jgi:hypothetical protein